MGNLDNYGVESGKIIGEDGKAVDVVDLLGGGEPVGDKTYKTEQYAPKSGRVIGEDGKVYNTVDLLKNLTDSKVSKDNTDGLVIYAEGGKGQLQIEKNDGIEMLLSTGEAKKIKLIVQDDTTGYTNKDKVGLQIIDDDLVVGSWRHMVNVGTGGYTTKINENGIMLCDGESEIKTSGNLLISTRQNHINLYGGMDIKATAEDSEMNFRGVSVNCIKGLAVNTSANTTVGVTNGKLLFETDNSSLEFRKQDADVKLKGNLRASSSAYNITGWGDIGSKSVTTQNVTSNNMILNYIDTKYTDVTGVRGADICTYDEPIPAGEIKQITLTIPDLNGYPFIKITSADGEEYTKTIFHESGVYYIAINDNGDYKSIDNQDFNILKKDITLIEAYCFDRENVKMPMDFVITRVLQPAQEAINLRDVIYNLQARVAELEKKLNENMEV